MKVQCSCDVSVSESRVRELGGIKPFYGETRVRKSSFKDVVGLGANVRKTNPKIFS
jgi:hypothetical protein